MRSDLLLLSTVEIVDRYWDQCALLFAPCIHHMDRELTIDDLHRKVLQGVVTVLIAKEETEKGPEVHMALAMEPIIYPGFTAMHCIVIGGRNMKDMASKYWRDIQGWMRVLGARKVQLLASSAVARLVKPFGFEEKYILMRLDLTEETNGNAKN